MSRGRRERTRAEFRMLGCDRELSTVRGPKRGQLAKNTPMTVTAKLGCLSIRTSGVEVAFTAGGKRPFMKMLAKRQSTREVAATTPVAQLNPTRGMSFCSMNGNTTPPKAPPVAAIPVAWPLR